MRKLYHLRRSAISSTPGTIGLTDTQKQALVKVYRYLIDLSAKETHADKIKDWESLADERVEDDLPPSAEQRE
jgi:hypothetical protein